MTPTSAATSEITTPGGKRTVSGGFVQWKANYTTWLETVSAIRTTITSLDSRLGVAGGDRFSPKITVGVMPAAGFDALCQLCRRLSCAVDHGDAGQRSACRRGREPLVLPLSVGRAGPRPIRRSASSRIQTCGPRSARTRKSDSTCKKNDMFTAGDSFRGKLNVFRNDITDYIDQVAFGTPHPIFGRVGRSCSIRTSPRPEFRASRPRRCMTPMLVRRCLRPPPDGKNLQTGFGLYSVPPQKVTTTGRCSVARSDAGALRDVDVVRWRTATSLPTYTPATSYDLVNLYLPVPADAGSHAQLLGREPSQSVLSSLRHSRRQCGRDTQNDVKWASAGPGIVFKGGLKYHFGGT